MPFFGQPLKIIADNYNTMSFRILTPMAQAVYGALGNASSREAIHALQQGLMTGETATQLIPLGEALKNHTNPSGDAFLSGLGQRDRDQLIAVLKPRSAAQLTHIALSLRRVPSGLPVSFSSPGSLLDEIQQVIGHPPYFVQSDLERSIRNSINQLTLLVRQILKNRSSTPYGIQELQSTAYQEKEGLIRWMAPQMEASAIILFRLMREPDLSDIIAGSAMLFYVWLVERHPEALEYMESMWPSEEERDFLDVCCVDWLGAAILFLKNQNGAGILQAVQRISDAHPSDRAMLEDLMQP